MVQKAKAPVSIRSDKELDTLMNDQVQVANNMLKYQIENNQRETDYYKKQVDAMKNQQKQIEERSMQTQIQYEQKLSYLQSQTRSFE